MKAVVCLEKEKIAREDMIWYPVTPFMGKPSFNGPECIKEVSSSNGRALFRNHEVYWCTSFWVVPVITSGSQISLRSNLKSISKFLSKEVDKPKVPVELMTGSDESKPDAVATCKSSRIKAEPDVPAHMEVHEYSKVKRDFEDFQAATGSDPRSNEISKPPAKKRANIKSSPVCAVIWSRMRGEVPGKDGALSIPQT
ncbi:hypothetical protein AKJ16_DCAP15241 [Drosera capensis]